jgi:hypothetical protein
MAEPGTCGDGFQIPSEHVNTIYGALSARRTAFDTMMWQVPALGLAAQAFLLTIAYGSSTSNTARFVSGALSVVVALVAIQTMIKHRANEKTDNLILKRIEDANGVRISHGVAPHDAPAVRGRAIGNELIYGYLEKRRSVRLWVTSLCGFAIAGGVAIVLTLADPSILQGNAG